METQEPPTGDYPTELRLPLLTAAEAQDTVGYLLLLESLDLTWCGWDAGQLVADLVCCLPTE